MNEEKVYKITLGSVPGALPVPNPVMVVSSTMEGAMDKIKKTKPWKDVFDAGTRWFEVIEMVAKVDLK